MPETISQSLLDGVRVRNQMAWFRLMQLFSPLVEQWVRRIGVSEADTRDVVQDVFIAVYHGLTDFRREESGTTFRGWLRRIAQFKARDHFRRLANRPVAEGGEDAHLRFQTLPDRHTDENNETTQRETDFLVRQGLELIRHEFEPKTWQAFRSVALDGRPAADVAIELGMSVGALYVAKSRVMKRLRTELEGLI